MKPGPPPPLLASLLSKLVDGALGETDKVRLEEILRKSPAARDYYRIYLATHLELTEAAQQMDFAPATHPGWFRRARIPLAVAALVPLALGLFLWAPWRDTRPAPAGKALAVTSLTRDVRWSLSKPPAPGLDLPSGRIDLTAGTLALTLSGKQFLTLAAPADFELIDENELFLHRGSASLRIDNGGSTYAIRVPRGKVVDLGTEFSVKVAADGTADVWVFEGKALVSLTSGAATREQQALTAGQSLRMGETLAPSRAKSADFVRPLRQGSDRQDSPVVIANFSAEFPTSTLGSGQPFGGTETPATGWKYLWNPSGILGNAADYQALVPNTVNTFPAANGGGIFPMFTKFGDLAFNAATQDNFQYGRIAKTSIHPGKCAPGKDYRAIIAYTILPDQGGKIHITNSSLSKHVNQGNGVDLDVFVNNTRRYEFGKDGFQSLVTTRFDGSLGTLSAGDTIYITLGNNGDDGHNSGEIYDAFDACVIDFQLVRVP
jgi:hypothetical protein